MHAHPTLMLVSSQFGESTRDTQHVRGANARNSAITDALADGSVHHCLGQSLSPAFVLGLHRLPPDTRAVLFLHDMLRWPPHDIGELLDMSIDTVDSTLRIARATFGTIGRDDRRPDGPGSCPPAR